MHLSAVSKVEGTLDVLSADQYRTAAKDLGLTIDDKGANTDWQDEIYRTGLAQDYDLSMSGGGNKTTYRASLGYGDQQSVIIGSDLKRANARININHSNAWMTGSHLTCVLIMAKLFQTRPPYPIP